MHRTRTTFEELDLISEVSSNVSSPTVSVVSGEKLLGSAMPPQHGSSHPIGELWRGALARISNTFPGKLLDAKNAGSTSIASMLLFETATSRHSMGNKTVLGSLGKLPQKVSKVELEPTAQVASSTPGAVFQGYVRLSLLPETTRSIILEARIEVGASPSKAIPDLSICDGNGGQQVAYSPSLIFTLEPGNVVEICIRMHNTTPTELEQCAHSFSLVTRKTTTPVRIPVTIATDVYNSRSIRTSKQY